MAKRRTSEQIIDEISLKVFHEYDRLRAAAFCGEYNDTFRFASLLRRLADRVKYERERKRSKIK